VVVAYIPIGLLWGTLAAAKGLSPLEALMMSVIVFAGSAQFVAVDMWHDPVPALLLTFTALIINIRHVLMSASLSRHVAAIPRALHPIVAYFLVDESWALAERRVLQTPLTFAYYLGITLPLACTWWISTGHPHGLLEGAEHAGRAGGERRRGGRHASRLRGAVVHRGGRHGRRLLCLGHVAGRRRGMSSSALLAILGMGIATYLTRLSGFYLLRGFNVSGRMKAALDALPPAVLMAVIAPVILTTGLSESVAAALTAVAGFFRLPLAVSILIGIASVVALRAMLH